MKRIAVFIFLSVLVVASLLAGCGTASSYATPTPQNVNPVDVVGTMAMADLNAKVTQQAVGIVYTSTAQVMQVTQNAVSTQAAAAVTQQYRQDVAATEQQARQDAAATQQRIDAISTEQQMKMDMAATAQQADRNVIGTATAQQQAFYNSMTQAVVPTHDMWTAQAVIVEQALATNEVEISNLNVKQQAQKNTAEWLTPFLIALALAVTAVVYVLRYSRVREVTNEETGDKVLVLDNERMLNPKLLTGPILDLTGKTVSVPDLVDPKRQDEFNRRAQIVDAIRGLPTQQPTANGVSMLNGLLGETPAPSPRFHILDEDAGVPERVLDAHTQETLEQAWKEANRE